ncbi:MAG: helix-turn-helix domain-containing protein [Caulobacterales bacterium]|uniref:helix-turn-helix domain-containing protein n=1 Tax=Glycocaulis sp. TaxID=1969725 RepID=UPI003FA18507
MSDHEKRKASSIDVHVGHRVRLKRQSMGLSQQELGERLGITFQQLQKYERGANRISAGKLFELSQALGVNVAWFFEGVTANVNAFEPKGDAASVLYDSVALRAAESLMRIKDKNVRVRLVKTIEALADS